MFQDLDDALRKVINNPPAPPELQAAAVSFITPDKDFPASITGPTVDLFLYEVKENRALRDPTPVLEKSGTGFTRRPPPLRVDSCYLATTWSTGAGAARVAQEHRLLGQTLQWLSRFPIIPDAYLAGGSLQNQAYAPPTMVAQMHEDRNMGQFWTAVGTPPRPAFYVTVTVAMDLGLKEEGSLVTTRLTEVRPSTGVPAEGLVQIGGQVMKAGGEGIPDAMLDILDAGLRAISDADGRYSFVRVPVGAHSIRVVAVGFQPKTQPLVVPGRPGDYDVTLDQL